MKILFVTDFVCPFCVVGSEALKQALDETGLEAEIQIQPFELTEEPKERVDTFHDEKRRGRYQVLADSLQELGLDIKLPPRVVPRPYTRLAFEGWHYAESKGIGDQYADAVYRAYFVDEKDIGRIDVLTELAGRIGLNPEEFRRTLEEGNYTQRQKEAVFYAREQLQIEHVPTIYVDGRKVEFPAYQKSSWIRFFQGQHDKQTIPQEDASQENQVTAGEGGCGPDGCEYNQ